MIKNLIKHPEILYDVLTKGKEFVIIKKICEVTQKSFNEVSSYYEFIKKATFLDNTANIAKSNHVSVQAPEALYVICRLLKPNYVIETGVASGVSSSYILKAMDDNNKGTLISIDKPDYGKKVADVIDGKEIGWVVPNNLRKRWELNLGTSKDILEILLKKINNIDIFFHDSEHTYENMIFEYRTAWSYMRKNGLLLSHDIDWNKAFRDFSIEVDRPHVEIFNSGLGAILK